MSSTCERCGGLGAIGRETCRVCRGVGYCGTGVGVLSVVGAVVAAIVAAVLLT